jgi:FtsP/CotA-like multicopper oxidase with cupredoxin domain
MNRRDFVRLGWATVIGAGVHRLGPAFAQAAALQPAPAPPQNPIRGMLAPKATERAADFTLGIAPTTVELAPQVVISTIGYSNKIPGPLLRMREGKSVTVDVVNDTDVPEYVHWHGLFVPSDVDGAEEEGTLPVPPPWPPAVSIRGQASGVAMVPLTHRSHDGPASRRLHRPVRFFHDRFLE